MIEPHRIMSRIAEAAQVYLPSSWTNTSAGLPSLSFRKSTNGSPPCFSNTAIGSRDLITTTEDDGTVAMKTKKPWIHKGNQGFSIVGSTVTPSNRSSPSMSTASFKTMPPSSKSPPSCTAPASSRNRNLTRWYLNEKEDLSDRKLNA